jgi:UDP-GlcNAc:undecaprenyl-phosphate/decaprenyl-phosphate GlcNAc-1-phosphate transferase
MSDWLIELCLLFLFIVFSTIVWWNIAKRIPTLNVLTGTNAQRVGIGFIFAIPFLWFLSPVNETSLWIALAVFALLISGLADDIWDTSVWLRLFIQILAALSLLTIDLGLPDLAVVLLAMIWMNMFNFMDGSNGMMGLTAVVTTSLAFIWIWVDSHSITFTLLIELLIALIVFGWGNFRNKAIWISGDTGSVILGLICFYIYQQPLRNADFDVQMNVLACSFAVFLTETGLTLLQRIIKGENILKRHQQHLYQRLIYVAGWKHMHVAILYAGLQLLITMVLILQLMSEVDDNSLTFTSIGIFAGLSICWLYFNSKIPRLQATV